MLKKKFSSYFKCENKDCKFKGRQKKNFQKLSKTRKLVKASKENLTLSEIKASLNKLFFFVVMRIIFNSFIAIKIFDPMLSVKSIDSFVFNSQGRDLKAYKREVNAPTGHKSITFPEILDAKICEMYVPISVF